MTNVSESNNRSAKAAHDLTAALVDAGSAWARYGLGVARLALETSARTLGTTAAALGSLSSALEVPEGERKEGAAAASVPAVEAVITTQAVEVPGAGATGGPRAAAAPVS